MVVIGQWLQIVHFVFILVKLVLIVKTVFELIHFSGVGII